MARGKFLMRAAVVICITAVLVVTTADYLQKSDVNMKNQEFFNTDENYDVLFFGSSHVVMGILPMVIWEEYGMTSYNLSNGGQRLAEDYWVLKEALERQNPSLVVIDTYTTNIDKKYDESIIASLHETFDPMPLSRTKIEAIYDTFPEEYRTEFLFPFSVYHNRWESISEIDFNRMVSYQKGAYENTAFAIASVTPMPTIDFSLNYTGEAEDTVNTAYLRKCIELCQERQIPVLLLMTPFNSEKHIQSSVVNTAYVLAEEYGVPFLDGMEYNPLNAACDFYDADHLNASGARKWSSFVGGYIMRHYAITDKREDAACSQWWEDYACYTEWKLEQTDNAWAVHGFMTALQDDAFNYCIYIDPGSGAFWDDAFWNMMENAGEVNRPAGNGQGYFCVIDHLSGTVTEMSGSLEASGVSEEMKERITGSRDSDVHFFILDRQSGAVLKDVHYAVTN